MMVVTHPGPPRTLTIGREETGQLEFKAPFVPADDKTATMRIRAHGQGLSVDGEIELGGWRGGFDEFIAYFVGLADAWRGWAGSRDWADDSGTVYMFATHDGIGRVALQVEIRSGPTDLMGGWRARIWVALEPGSLEVIAIELGHLAGEDA